MVAVIVLSFSIIGQLIYSRVSNFLTEEIEESLVIKGESIAGQLNAILQEKGTLVRQMSVNRDFVQYLQSVRSRDEATSNPHHQAVAATLNAIMATDETLGFAYVVSEPGSFYLGDNGMSDPGYQVTQRPWYPGAASTKDIYYSEPYIDSQTGQLVISVMRPVKTAGNILGFVAVDILLDVLPTIMESYTLGQTGYSFLTTLDGRLMYHPDKSLVMSKKMNEMSDAMGTLANDIAAHKKGVTLIDDGRGENYVAYSPVPLTNWTVAVTIAESEALASLGSFARSTLLYFTISLFVLVFVAVLLIRQALDPIRRAAAAMQDIAQGKGDLTRRLSVESQDEVGELAKQFNAFVERMQLTLQEVRAGADKVYFAAGEIARSSEEQAARSEQAAANLQETSASMEQITATVKHSADSAAQANQLVLGTADTARQGQGAMHKVETTMDDINHSAGQISDIISLIDGIAFQTNILALNASVEAARAGEHGRGFAVVAQEVRALSGRSAEAAKEIRTLIDTSVNHVRAGTSLMRSAGTTMQDIVDSVSKVTDVIGEISAGTREQSAGIGQINQAVAEMDSMTQQNAGMVQQISRAAADMRHHAERLNELLAAFVLGNDVLPGMAMEGVSPRRLAQPSAGQHQRITLQPEPPQEWESF
ncbi:methyl-accepting chemotaxis protein [Zobellella aerophila]|uniref:Methyl-accepting chemotaxis protein n=1 Tax=Zobellella aerophila TaxID=870480 RepID=A0ABP6VU56_9GAMM